MGGDSQPTYLWPVVMETSELEVGGQHVIGECERGGASVGQCHLQECTTTQRRGGGVNWSLYIAPRVWSYLEPAECSRETTVRGSYTVSGILATCTGDSQSQ